MATVKFSVVRKINPIDKDANPKFYACAQSAGVQSLEDMSKVIEKNCTLTSTDVMAVLHAMDEVMREQLANGQIVRIGDMGYARLSLRSEGTETEEAFNASHIRGARVVFTPSANTRKALRTLAYTQVPKLPVKVSKAV
jgi:predicted histone-like DNA-binding protein